MLSISIILYLARVKNVLFCPIAALNKTEHFYAVAFCVQKFFFSDIGDIPEAFMPEVFIYPLP